MPGHRALIFYHGDTVWHERILLWPCGEKGDDTWVVATPGIIHDGVFIDEFAEPVDVQKVSGLGNMGEMPFLGNGVYQIRDAYDDAEMLKLIAQGRDEALAHTHGGLILSCPTRYTSPTTGCKRGSPDKRFGEPTAKEVGDDTPVVDRENRRDAASVPSGE